MSVEILEIDDFCPVDVLDLIYEADLDSVESKSVDVSLDAFGCDHDDWLSSNCDVHSDLIESVAVFVKHFDIRLSDQLDLGVEHEYLVHHRVGSLMVADCADIPTFANYTDKGAIWMRKSYPP